MKANVPVQEKKTRQEQLETSYESFMKNQYDQLGNFIPAKGMVMYLSEIPQTDEVPKSKGFLSPDEHPYAVLGSKATLPLKVLDVESTDFDKHHAYLHDGYIYLFRGPQTKELAFEPGIYYDADNDRYFIRECDPNSARHNEEYRATPDHILLLNPLSVKQLLHDNEEKIYARQRATSHRFFVPSVSVMDDILKRLSKMFLIAKNVDLDQCRANFVDKNSLFNYKQLLKGDNRLSMMLFQRGIDALRLRYYIVVEEVDPEHPVGDALKQPIVVCSDDTYATAPGDTENKMNRIISNYRDMHNQNLTNDEDEEELAA